jgi:hypothetical protein
MIKVEISVLCCLCLGSILFAQQDIRETAEGVYTIETVTEVNEKNATYAQFVSDDFVKDFRIDIQYTGNDQFEVATQHGRLSDEVTLSQSDLLHKKSYIGGAYNGAGGETLELEFIDSGKNKGRFAVLYDKTFGTWYDQLSEKEAEEFNRDDRNIQSVSFTGILKRNIRAYFDESASVSGRVCTAVDNLRLRADCSLSGRIITTMQKGSGIKIIAVGDKSIIDGIASNWIQVSVLENAHDTGGSDIASGISGWCFGGYVK